MAKRRKKSTDIVPASGKPDRIGNRTYSDRDKAIALATVDFYGGNVNRAYEHLKAASWEIARNTLYRWASEEEPSAFVEQLRKEATDSIVRQMDFGLEIATRRLVSLLPTASFRELVGYVSVLVEKSQLLKEQPTHRVRNESVLAVLAAKLEMMPSGDGREDSYGEPASEKEIVIRPSNGAGKPRGKGKGPSDGSQDDTPADAGDGR